MPPKGSAKKTTAKRQKEVTPSEAPVITAKKQRLATPEKPTKAKKGAAELNKDVKGKLQKIEKAVKKSANTTTNDKNENKSKKDFPPLTNETIRIAVKLWGNNKAEALKIYGPISEWNTSQVTDMSYLLSSDSSGSLNEDLNNWDVSNVTNMNHLFHNNYFRFNHSLDKWNVNHLPDMDGLGKDYRCIMWFKPVKTVLECCMTRGGVPVELRAIVSAFLVPTLDNRSIRAAMELWNTNKSACIRKYGHMSDWNTSCVTDMSALCTGACGSGVNIYINDWDVSNVVNMARMFKSNHSFNQPLNRWDVRKVTDMTEMFSSTSFNQPLSNWNTCNVRFMGKMFSWSSFNQPLPGSWKPAVVVDVAEMFANAREFNQPLNDWDMSLVSDTSKMFKCAKAFNQPLNNWNVSKVTTMKSMFEEAIAFNQPLNKWNVSKVTKMTCMFKGATAFNQPLDNWNVSTVTDMREMFRSSAFNQSLDKWKVRNLRFAQDIFLNCAMEKSRHCKVYSKWEETLDLLIYEKFLKDVWYQEGPDEFTRVLRSRDRKIMTREEVRGVVFEYRIHFPGDKFDEE